MKRVVIESPYSGDIEGNKKYLLECLRDSVARGEAPFASHALYPLFMSEETEREHGILLGFEWGTQAELVAVYIDRGVSKGMSDAMKFYADNGLKIDVRLLGTYENATEITERMREVDDIMEGFEHVTLSKELRDWIIKKFVEVK